MVVVISFESVGYQLVTDKRTDRHDEYAYFIAHYKSIPNRNKQSTL